jgi:Na+-translocating ferredoxin:NAD+ oxidoreductase subunit C
MLRNGSMGETRNTFPGGVWLPTVWPRQLPALVQIRTPASLFVPILPPGSGEVAVKPVGDVVQPGESLLRVQGGSGAVALAPRAGTVVGKVAVTLTDGRPATAVELRIADPSEAPVAAPSDEIEKDLPELPAVTRPAAEFADFMNVLRRSGVFADRRTSPELMHQLTQAAYRPIDTIICSCLDHDPMLRLNALLAYRHAGTICAAVNLLSTLLSAPRTLIAVDSATPGVFRRPLAKLARKSKLKLASLPARYPHADPTLLLHTLADRRLRVGRSPVERGVVLLDAAAALAIGRAVFEKRPMLEMPVALRDRMTAQSHYLSVPVGTAASAVLDALGIAADGAELFGGDALRKTRIGRHGIIGPSENVVHVSAPVAAAPQPCVRCSWCADRCPTGVQPAWLLEAAQQLDPELATRAGIDSCIDCGICDYVCPSNLPIVESIRTLKRAG